MTDPARPRPPVVCPACGAKNKRNRFFCDQCGTYIRPRSRELEQRVTVGPTTPTAPSAEPGMDPATPAAAPQAAAPRPTPPEGGAGRMAMFAPLLALLAVLTVLGVAILATLRPFGEQASSSASDTGTTSAAAGGAATTATVARVTSSTSVPIATTTPVPTTTAATGAATTSTTKPLAALPPNKVEATSRLAGDGATTYGPDNLVDGKLATAWNEGAAGTGEGQYVSFRYDKKVTVTGLRIANGYQKSDLTFAGNVRVRRLRVSFSDRPPVEIGLKDAKGYQDVVLSHPSVLTSLRLTILATYPERQWDDAALSEVIVMGFTQ